MPEHVSAKPDRSGSGLPGVGGSDQQTVILSGISGAGKTTALKAFEDAGFEAIDNPPFMLVLPLLRDPANQRLVIGIDARTRDLDVPALLKARRELSAGDGAGITVVYLDCDEDVALRRFKETRRRHPLAPDGSIADGLAIEKEMLRQLREEADHVLDTSLLAPRELKRWILGAFAAEDPAGMTVQIVSFSYRQGLPREADLVFDVRFLANPHYDSTLRPMSGLDEAVGAYVQADPGTATLLEHLQRLFAFVLPRYEQEGKSYLTIAIGCTGGRHRSVYMAETLSAYLFGEGWAVQTIHRDIDKDRQVQADR